MDTVSACALYKAITRYCYGFRKRKSGGRTIPIDGAYLKRSLDLSKGDTLVAAIGVGMKGVIVT